MISIISIINGNLIEIISSEDGKVWINSIDGMIARFSPRGIDIHSMDANSHCLDCQIRKTTPDDWRTFVDRVRHYYNIDLAQFPEIHP